MSSLRLTTSLQQRMVLTPQLRQRIEMLQMTSMELNELIEQELVANPILEEVLSGEEVPGEVSDSFEEIDYGREFQDYLDPGYRTQEIEYKDDAPSFEQFLSHTESLSEHLEWQLNMLELSDKMMDVCVAVVGNLDADGRLTASIEELVRMCDCSEEMVEKARRVVMGLEPVGCGALDVKECLLAQLEADGEGESLASELVREHLEDLQPHRLQHLS